ncbi:4008_t:CDS:2, partial [Acaulospora colombiana]
MPDDIPSIKEIKTWDHPGIEYFETFPYEIWSLRHFVHWAIENNLDKEISYRTFYKALKKISEDQEASPVLHNFVQKLLRNKKFDAAETRELWDHAATVSDVNKAVDVVKVHINLDDITSQRVNHLVLPTTTKSKQSNLPEILTRKRRGSIYLDYDD